MDLAGVMAVGLLALCALLPVLGELRAAMRVPSAEEVQAGADAKLAARILEFDDVNAYARGVLGRVYDDQLLPDRRKAVRS